MKVNVVDEIFSLFDSACHLQARTLCIMKYVPGPVVLCALDICLFMYIPSHTFSSASEITLKDMVAIGGWQTIAKRDKPLSMFLIYVMEAFSCTSKTLISENETKTRVNVSYVEYIDAI